MKKEISPSFADSLCQVRVRKIKSVFFTQMDTLIDWRLISNIINKHYSRGTSAVGTPAYSGLLLFKMSLLQTWYGMSDYDIEDRINDSISFSKFCGLTLEESSPDHSTLSRFRKEMTKKKVYDKLMKALNKQLAKHSIVVKSGVMVDASVVESPLRPKGKAVFEVDGEGLEIEVRRNYSSNVDQDASWLKKRGKLHYGYKKHYVTDAEGLVLGVLTTSANKNEITNLEEVLSTVNLESGTSVKADKGYKSKKNDAILVSKRLRNHILKKSKRGQKLTSRELSFNKGVGKDRFKIERTFGSIKRWFKGGFARYRGIEKMHTQNVLEGIAYNLYRSPGIIALNR